MIVLRELGVTYWHGKHFDLAITVLAEAVALSMEVGDIFGEATTRMNLGIAYWYRGDYEQAMAAYAPCEAIFRKIASRSYLARLYNNQGLVYRELGEIARARECFNSSLNLTRSENDHLETASVLDSLAGLWQHVGSTREALATWQEALSELERLPEAPRFLYNLIQERMEAARLTEQVDGFPAPENHPLTGYDGRA
jgi:tetratricopeptide (TPR) repeat protein